MGKSFEQHLENELKAILPDVKGLAVALSGGADSLSLLCGLRRLAEKYPVSLLALHCNFHLRGLESDGDENFCREVCSRLGIELEVKDLPQTRMEALRQGESIEMACRRLRYEWFAEYTVAGYAIALGHHSEDNRETVMLNLLRGSGLKGLTGMDVFDPNRLLWRPLLKCSKQEIENYLRTNELTWRTDSSNLIADVKRNRIRLEVMPVIRANFPDASKGLDRTIENLGSDYRLFKEMVDKLVSDVYNRKEREINLVKLREITQVPQRILIEILAPLGFTPTQCEDIANVNIGEGYKTFKTSDFVVFANGSHALLRPVSDKEWIRTEASTLVELCSEIPELNYEVLEGDEVELVLGRARCGKLSPDTLLLDADVIDRYDIADGRYCWRKCESGDRLAPFGMKGRSKLISDIFTDMHASPLAKAEGRLLIAPDQRVIWLAPYRSSHFFAVPNGCKRLIVIHYSSAKKV